MDAILAKLLEAIPPLIYLIIGGGVVYYIMNIYTKRIKNVDERTKEANCKRNTAEINETKNNIKQILKSIGAIEKAVIFTNPETFEVLSQAKSPRQLNDIGREIFEHYKVDEFLIANMELFISDLEQRNPLTALDVEQESYIVLLTHCDDPLFNALKTAVYNAPQYKEVTITISTLCYVASLELRNEYLKKHPEIL